MKTECVVQTYYVLNFPPMILINKWSNFVYCIWGCISNYHPLSYPLRFMCNKIVLWIAILDLLNYNFYLLHCHCCATFEKCVFQDLQNNQTPHEASVFMRLYFPPWCCTPYGMAFLISTSRRWDRGVHIISINSWYKQKLTKNKAFYLLEMNWK